MDIRKMKPHLYADLTLHSILAQFTNKGLNQEKKKMAGREASQDQ
mgnify:CR=1 FL=1